jgi:nitrite reductase (NADH) large subunit
MNVVLPIRRRLVLVGNGMAGVRTLEEIISRAPGMFDITVFGAEPHGNYNRIMLSPVLAGEKQFSDIVTHDRAWYLGHGIELIAGEAVVSVDCDNRFVTGANGTRRDYDVLLLATGSVPIVLPVPGVDLPGVTTFRDIADVNAMLSASGRAVVIGGGLLGLEAAHGLVRRGMDVTVVHLAPTLMERQLDPLSGGLLAADLAARGIRIITNANTTALLGEGRVEALRLADGEELPADLVVMAAGVRPNVTLARSCGLAVGRGVKVDDRMRTSEPDVYAVGECVEHRGEVFGLVAPIWDMAKVCADAITGAADTEYRPSLTGTRLKVTGVDMFSVGDFTGDAGTEEIVFRDAARGIHKRLVMRGDALVGAVLYGDARDGGWYFDLIRDGVDISAQRDLVIFGPGVANVPTSVTNIGELADTAEICGCNGITKQRIVAAIAQHGLTDLAGVRAHTKASASCGSCTGKVEALLALVAGDAYTAAPTVAPMCKCTTLGHDSVRAAIVAQHLLTVPQVMSALKWSTRDGCASCRPALNYYLLCAWPGEYVDDSRNRIMNERMHANIQRDGTFSVVPRMWGGVTSAAELRAIADVVDKYEIPTVKITGGQRIDMLGVRREQLPNVWRDLNAAGMVSGHAYGKALRTVKTCVGSEWCRFGTQDSTAMGIALERMLWGTWTPAKVKLAVSGCPRNCAESTIKDFGVIAVDSGWELHVGGNGGIKLRGTELLAKVATEAEVLEYCGAFLQLYREQARYLERTAHWIERVGMPHVIAHVADDATGRAALYARFLHSQSFAQKDPWAERVDGYEAHEFRPLAVVD